MESPDINTSSTSLTNEENRAKPYIEVALKEAIGLQDLSEKSTLKPYIQIYQLDREWITKYEYKDGGVYVWGETLQMDIDFNTPLNILVLMKDINGRVHILSSYQIQPSFLNTLSNHPKTVQLSLNSHELKIGPDQSEGPRIVMSFKLKNTNSRYKHTVLVDKHKNIIEDTQMFTLYEVTVNRNDGVSWKIKSRYSEISRIRNKLIKVYPELRAIPFPPKTYFSLLGCWFSYFSKFRVDLIYQRKKSIEEFLNEVLKKLDEIRFDSLFKLLEINPFYNE